MKRLVLVWSCAFLAVGCASKGPRPLCSATYAPDAQKGIPAHTWFTLLLHGYSPDRNEVPRPPLDCQGTPIVLEAAADACSEPAPQAEPLAGQKLSANDVSIHTLSDDKMLVWAITRRFHNGEALGPVALVHRDGRVLNVVALGTLRGMTEHPKLRLEKMGNAPLLVAESDTCDNPNASDCQKLLRLVPLRNQRFIPEPFRDPEGGCAGPAAIYTYREKTVRLPGGGVRKSEMTATLAFKPTEIVIHEHVAVRKTEPNQPAAPPTLHHNADGRRTVQFQNGKLIPDGPSLWTLLVENVGR